MCAIALAIAVAFVGVATPAFAAQNPTVTAGTAASTSFQFYSHPAADCSTGAGTTCNVVFTLGVNFTSNLTYACYATLSGGTASNTMFVTLYANTGNQATAYVTGTTGQTYGVALLCGGY